MIDFDIGSNPFGIEIVSKHVQSSSVTFISRVQYHKFSDAGTTLLKCEPDASIFQFEKPSPTFHNSHVASLGGRVVVPFNEIFSEKIVPSS
jgi:hypothetical protein